MAEEGDDDFGTFSERGGAGGGDRDARAPAAVGVEYLLDGKVESAHISAPGSHGRPGSAVVVTAGALHTPKVRWSMVVSPASSVVTVVRNNDARE